MTVRDMKKITSNDEALKLFEESSIKHSEASEAGEYKKCNKNHDIIIACILYLYDSQQLKLLEPFLEHPHVGVRLWAAFVLLSIEREKAEEVLRDIQNGPYGILRGNALYTLKELEKGNLKFPWQWARKEKK